jgi:hypothetical protein
MRNFKFATTGSNPETLNYNFYIKKDEEKKENTFFTARVHSDSAPGARH